MTRPFRRGSSFAIEGFFTVHCAPCTEHCSLREALAKVGKEKTANPGEDEGRVIGELGFERVLGRGVSQGPGYLEEGEDAPPAEAPEHVTGARQVNGDKIGA